MAHTINYWASEFVLVTFNIDKHMPNEDSELKPQLVLYLPKYALHCLKMFLPLQIIIMLPLKYIAQAK